jgi:O-methyltransferase involved in polyketide biosynthesis
LTSDKTSHTSNHSRSCLKRSPTKMTGATDASQKLTAVAQTAMLVAAARLAEARHDNPVLKDELLEVMIGSSKEVIAAMNQCIEETQQQQRGRL